MQKRNTSSCFTCTWNVVFGPGTRSRTARLAPVSIVPFEPRPYIPPPLLGFRSTTGLFTTRSAPVGLGDFPIGECAPPTELPVLILRSSCPRAAAHAPVEVTRPSFIAKPMGVLGRWQGCPKRRWGGPRIMLSEAYSPFTRIAAWVLAEPPFATLCAAVLRFMSFRPSAAPNCCLH